jgi:hypothetical protein
MQLGEPVECGRGEGRQPDEVRLILFGEVPLQTIRSLGSTASMKAASSAGTSGPGGVLAL